MSVAEEADIEVHSQVQTWTMEASFGCLEGVMGLAMFTRWMELLADPRTSVCRTLKDSISFSKSKAYPYFAAFELFLFIY